MKVATSDENECLWWVERDLPTVAVSGVLGLPLLANSSMRSERVELCSTKVRRYLGAFFDKRRKERRRGLC